MSKNLLHNLQFLDALWMPSIVHQVLSVLPISYSQYPLISDNPSPSLLSFTQVNDISSNLVNFVNQSVLVIFLLESSNVVGKQRINQIHDSYLKTSKPKAGKDNKVLILRTHKHTWIVFICCKNYCTHHSRSFVQECTRLLFGYFPTQCFIQK